MLRALAEADGRHLRERTDWLAQPAPDAFDARDEGGRDGPEPRGQDAKGLMGMVNEAQMLLHDHPVNQTREDSGRLPVNGLWLWGGGILPAMRPRLDLAASDAEEIRALAAAAGVANHPSPSNLEELRDAGHFRNVLATLAPAPEDFDLAAYLAKLEQAWFKPVFRGLTLGRLREVRMDLLAGPGRAVSLTPVQVWRFWR
jgi:hypothetical protein